MDIRLGEATWVRLISLLAWTILMLVKRGVSQLIELIERRMFVSGEKTSRRREQDLEDGERTLLPPLNDEFVLHIIWPLLHRNVNVSLLWRLRRVNKAWKGKVGSTLEWSAMEMVRLDSPGYLRVLASKRIPRPSLRERVESERAAFLVLLGERLVDFTEQTELMRTEGLEPVGVREFRGPLEKEAEEAERESSNSFCSIDLMHSERGWNRDRDYYYRSEEEEIEAYASSTDSSMGVYYPRHSMRVR